MGDWNFSELVQTLWKTCADNGVGSLLRPWQKRRDAYADADVKRINAQGDYDAELIRQGERHLADFQRVSNGKVALLEDRREPDLDLESLPLIIANQQSAGALRKEINVAKALLHAEGELARDSSPPPADVADGDWLRRWRDYAGEVSSESLQSIWGRLLAGEVKEPGAYSLRVLELLRNLSSQDAKLIAKLAPFVLGGVLFRSPQVNRIVEEAGLTFGAILYLEEIGIIGTRADDVSRVWPNESSGDSYEALLTSGQVGLLLHHTNKLIRIEMPGYPLTLTGRQVLEFCHFTADRSYLIQIGMYYKDCGCTVELCDLVTGLEGRPEIASSVLL